MKLFLLILFMSSLNAVKAQCNTDVEVICYWGSWSIYREEIGYFNASHIDTDICTTLVYSFIGLDLDLDITSLDQNADITNGGFLSFNQLKEKNPCLKTMLAIGGWNEGSRKYSVVASTEEGRKRFANSVLRFLVYYKFDGIDIDWEYPTIRGGLPDDGKNLALLLKEIKATISPWNLKLSIAVSIDDTLIGIGYPVADIAPSVDHVNIMAYDYISSNSPVTGLSSPLSEIKKSIGKWLDNGLPPEKLVLGLPSYAKNFVLEDPAQGDIGAPVSEIGRPGIWTNEKGLLAYYEVLYTFEIIPKEDIHVYLSDDTYYAYYDDEWFTYDNEETFKTKVTYALDQKLKGIMIWALELDDFSGAFGPKYPLLNAIQNSINQFKKTNKYA